MTNQTVPKEVLAYTTRTTGWVALEDHSANFTGTHPHTTDSGRTWHKASF